MVAEIFTQAYSDLGIPTWLFTIAIIWSLAWKGLALWKSARKNQSIWFVVLLILNTLGILEILYIFVFSKIQLSKKLIKRQMKRPTRRQVKRPIKKPIRKITKGKKK